MKRIMRFTALALSLVILMGGIVSFASGEADVIYQLKADYLQIRKAERPDDTILSAKTVDDVIIIDYYGNHRGYECVVLGLRDENYTADIGELEVGKYTFYFASGGYVSRFLLYKGGEFIRVDDAYNNGLINDRDLYRIAEEHGWFDWDDPFTDVTAEDWFFNAVFYNYENGVMSGMGNDKFAPNQKLTREQLMQVFCNLAKPRKDWFSGQSVFKDVPTGQWYSVAVKWAWDAGITSGVEKDRFGIGEYVTREQLATFIMNYVEYVGGNTETRTDLSLFSDADKVSSWAEDGMKFCVNKGIITGRANKTLDPRTPATRAELAQVMSKFLEAGYVYRVEFDHNGGISEGEEADVNFRYIAPGTEIGLLDFVTHTEKEGYLSEGYRFEGKMVNAETVFDISEHIVVYLSWTDSKA